MVSYYSCSSYNPLLARLTTSSRSLGRYQGARVGWTEEWTCHAKERFKMSLPKGIMALVVLALTSTALLAPASGATREQKREEIQSVLKNAATAEESYA